MPTPEQLHYSNSGLPLISVIVYAIGFMVMATVAVKTPNKGKRIRHNLMTSIALFLQAFLGIFLMFIGIPGTLMIAGTNLLLVQGNPQQKQKRRRQIRITVMNRMRYALRTKTGVENLTPFPQMIGLYVLTFCAVIILKNASLSIFPAAETSGVIEQNGTEFVASTQFLSWFCNGVIYLGVVSLFISSMFSIGEGMMIALDPVLFKRWWKGERPIFVYTRNNNQRHQDRFDQTTRHSKGDKKANRTSSKKNLQGKESNGSNNSGNAQKVNREIVSRVRMKIAKHVSKIGEEHAAYSIWGSRPGFEAVPMVGYEWLVGGVEENKLMGLLKNKPRSFTYYIGLGNIYEAQHFGNNNPNIWAFSEALNHSEMVAIIQQEIKNEAIQQSSHKPTESKKQNPPRNNGRNNNNGHRHSNQDEEYDDEDEDEEETDEEAVEVIRLDDLYDEYIDEDDDEEYDDDEDEMTEAERRIAELRKLREQQKKSGVKKSQIW